MSDFIDSLVLKYGLSSDPTNDQINKWASLAAELIRKGTDPEEAGHSAAKVTFPDYRSYIRKSQADSILTLLEKAKNK